MVHGYKGFDINMTCRGFQYEVGQTYEMDGKIVLCERGFHFCRNMADVMGHYGQKGCRYTEVEALGRVVDDGIKSVTDKLRIVCELTWAEVLEVMYRQEELGFEDVPFPADEIIKARKTGTLGEMLPSGTEFPVRFSNGERNILIVCSDKDHTYLVTKHIMAESFSMNIARESEGGWPACGMREHVQGIYNMLPEDIRKVIIPKHIRQRVHSSVIECDDPAFLLSAVNVFGEDAWQPDVDLEDSQIDIFRDPETRTKKRPGASSASWWWLRSADSSIGFSNVITDGSSNAYYANFASGVVVGFCIEDRGGYKD